jgi:hypothetical protein
LKTIAEQIGELENLHSIVIDGYFLKAIRSFKFSAEIVEREALQTARRR